MNNLKNLTKDIHKKAEESPFAIKLANGDLTIKEYYFYLKNQYEIYKNLEDCFDISEINDIKRANLILEDIHELEELSPELKVIDFKITDTTNDYINHIKSISNNQILAHVYVRHFGDMFGGALISKKIPGSGKMYKFNNRSYLIQTVRNMLSDELENEAKKCFDFAIRLFKELENDLE